MEHKVAAAAFGDSGAVLEGVAFAANVAAMYDGCWPYFAVGVVPTSLILAVNLREGAAVDVCCESWGCCELPSYARLV